MTDISISKFLRPFEVVIIVFCILFFTGCVSSSQQSVSPASSPDTSNFTGRTSQTTVLPLATMPGIPNSTPTVFFCPPEEDCSTIRINSLSGYHFGEIINFGGTTTLNTSEIITITIIESGNQQCAKRQSSGFYNQTVRYCDGGIRKNIPVGSDYNGVNTFSWDVNTSEFDFYPGRQYDVSMQSSSNYTQYNFTRFVLGRE